MDALNETTKLKKYKILTICSYIIFQQLCAKIQIKINIEECILNFFHQLSDYLKTETARPAQSSLSPFIACLRGCSDRFLYTFLHYTFIYNYNCSFQSAAWCGGSVLCILILTVPVYAQFVFVVCSNRIYNLKMADIWLQKPYYFGYCSSITCGTISKIKLPNLFQHQRQNFKLECR